MAPPCPWATSCRATAREHRNAPTSLTSSTLRKRSSLRSHDGHAVCAAGERCVVDEDVDAAKGCHGLPHHVVHLSGVGDVEGEGKGALAKGAHLLGDAFDVPPPGLPLVVGERGGVSARAGEHDVAPGAGEGQGGCPANAPHTACAGNDGNAAFKLGVFRAGHGCASRLRRECAP